MDNFQLMDDYLKGDLPSKEVSAFNRRLKNDPQFETEFREMKAMQDAAKESAKISTMAKLQQIEMSIANQETTKIEFNMKKLVSVAASLILIATVSYFTVFNTPDVATGQEIYDEYYETYQNIASGAERGSAAEIISLRDKAYFAYDSRSFSEASSLFSSLLEEEKSGLNYLYAGLSNLEAGNLEEAKENLNTVVNSFENYRAQGQWFLAMSLLKENSESSTEESLSSLVSLSLGKSSHKEDAKQILAKLGLTIEDDGTGEVIENHLKPDSTEGNPDGSAFLGRRQVQFGKIQAQDGSKYRYYNDEPILSLEVGDLVDFIVLKRKKNGKGFGFAVILSEL